MIVVKIKIACVKVLGTLKMLEMVAMWGVDVLIPLIAVPVSQCMHASNQIVYCKRTKFLIVHDTPIKLGGNVGPMNAETM